MAEQTIKEQLKGKKTHICGLALVAHGLLDMFGIAPLDQGWMEGSGDSGAVSAGIGAGISALRAGLTKAQEFLAEIKAKVDTLQTELQALRAGQSSDSEGSA